MTIPSITSTIGEKRRFRKRVRMMRRLTLVAIVCVLGAITIPKLKQGLSDFLHGGHSPDVTPIRITVSGTRLEIPGNMLRYAHERRETTLDKVHLYFEWPSMQGYRPAARNSFNYTIEEGSQNIVFATIEPRLTLRDMGERFEPVYQRLVDGEPMDAVRGLKMYRFKPELGEYEQEVLVHGEKANGEPFAALCLKGAWARHALTSCTRDVKLTKSLAVSYQFSNAMLARWPEMENAVLRTAFSFLPMNEVGLR